MSTESAPDKTTASHSADLGKAPQLVSPGGSVLHRVCIQCNNMFRVTPDKFDVKQCPACHKG